MKIGFLGFGEVASKLSVGLLAGGIEVFTCVNGRSQRTADLAKSADVKLCETFSELAESSDILLSTVVPAEAVNVAKDVGRNFKGLYVDLNNISPSIVNEVSIHVGNGEITDAAIIGSIKNGLNTPIIASGPTAEIFAELNNYGMNIEVVGSQLGQASALKMLRSAYTKGVAALLFESFYVAYQMGVDEPLWRFLTSTEGPDFKESSISRLKSSAVHARRRVQEMDQVTEFLSEYEDPMVTRAVAEFFDLLPDKMGIISEKPSDYRDIFRKIDNNRF
jgi:3-hydroxyisobutyrate dehydrogenase-like beta-hydroxyacid dehydrogenase